MHLYLNNTVSITCILRYVATHFEKPILKKKWDIIIYYFSICIESVYQHFFGSRLLTRFEEKFIHEIKFLALISED